MGCDPPIDWSSFLVNDELPVESNVEPRIPMPGETSEVDVDDLALGSASKRLASGVDVDVDFVGPDTSDFLVAGRDGER